ncbi:MAG: hypothetical protein AAGE96_05320 [Cyanobacteria bacterium P01_G01_bin.19]
MSSDIDAFFSEEIKAVATDSMAIASRAAAQLQEDVERQIRRNFKNPSAAFIRGVKIYEFETAVYVRLSPILSSHAQSQTISGSPNLWILLRDGVRLGFKKMGVGGFNWDVLKRRYRSRLSFVAVADGHVVLYKHYGQVFPIYKIQLQVQTKQRIEFYEKAEEVADKYGLSTENDPERNGR